MDELEARRQRAAAAFAQELAEAITLRAASRRQCDHLQITLAMMRHENGLALEKLCAVRKKIEELSRIASARLH